MKGDEKSEFQKKRVCIKPQNVSVFIEKGVFFTLRIRGKASLFKMVNTDAWVTHYTLKWGYRYVYRPSSLICSD